MKKIIKFDAFLADMVSSNATFGQTIGSNQMKMESKSVIYLGFAADM